MLVLTRWPGERVMMELPDGRLITIQTSGGSGGRIRVAIDAPRDIVVNREEVYHERRLRERRHAQIGSRRA